MSIVHCFEYCPVLSQIKDLLIVYETHMKQSVILGTCFNLCVYRLNIVNCALAHSESSLLNRLIGTKFLGETVCYNFVQ